MKDLSSGVVFPSAELLQTAVVLAELMRKTIVWDINHSSSFLKRKFLEQRMEQVEAYISKMAFSKIAITSQEMMIGRTRDDFESI